MLLAYMSEVSKHMKPILSLPKEPLRNAITQWKQALCRTSDEIVVFMTVKGFKTRKHTTTLGPAARYLV